MSSDRLSTLSSPADVKEDQIQSFADQQKEPPLNEEETKNAVADLYRDDYVKSYRKADRLYCDPSIPGQEHCLISYIPAKNAKPDESGIYGMIKVRGTYRTVEEASERATELINKVDSYHKIFQAYVGKPFPITDNKFYAAEKHSVSDEVEKIAAHDVQVYDEREKRELQEIKKAKEKLMEEVSEDHEDTPIEKYIVSKVKRSNAVWVYKRCAEKMKELREIFKTSMEELNELDQQDSELKDNYKEKYIADLQERNITPDQENIVQYFEDENCFGTGIETLYEETKNASSE